MYQFELPTDTFSTAWSKLPPTEKQIAAIESYNHTYGIQLDVKTKQDAHNVISVFVPKQYLEFENNKVKGTNISFTVQNKNRHESNEYNNFIKENLVFLEIKDGIAHMKLRKKIPSTLDVLEEAARYLDILDNNPAMSEDDDINGFLSPEAMDDLNEMLGTNPYNIIE